MVKQFILKSQKVPALATVFYKIQNSSLTLASLCASLMWINKYVCKERFPRVLVYVTFYP